MNITNKEFQNTGFYYTMSLISGKYKMLIIYLLSNKAMRYNELKRTIKDISFQSLTRSLRELEIDGLIKRKDYKENPPKVEYSLTEKAFTLVPILNELCNWGEINKKNVTHIFD